MKDLTLTPLLPAEAIQARVQELAEKINTMYAGEPLVMICVLKGAFMFFGDLLKHINVQPEIDFVRLTSYGSGMEQSRNIRFTKDVEISLEGKHVLLVEDIIDTGHSMDFLMRQLATRGVKTLNLVALIDKRERREVSVGLSLAGFIIPEGFLVGYGLDYAEHYRELPAVYIGTLTE